MLPEPEPGAAIGDADVGDAVAVGRDGQVAGDAGRPKPFVRPKQHAVALHRRRGPGPEPPPERRRRSDRRHPERPNRDQPRPPARRAGTRRRRRHPPRPPRSRPGAVALIPQRLRKLRRRGEPIRRQLLERGHHRRLDVARNRVALGGERAGALGDHARHHRLRGGAGERRVAREHLVEHRAQGVDVGAGGDLALAHRLLGAHVVRRAERHAGLGHPAPAGLAGRERDAEVGDQRLAVVQQDVLGLDVAVDHAVAVGVVERRRPLRS